MKPNAVDSSCSLVEILRARAVETPERNAYRFLSHATGAEESLTYAELDQAARTVSQHLQSITRPGDRALLLYRPGLDFIHGFLGCLYAGVIAVPAYPPHPTRPARDLPKLRAIIGDARPAAILTSSAVIAGCDVLFTQAPDLATIPWVATDALPAATGRNDLLVSPDDLAFIQYTSGSTGLPKGVMVSHGNLMHNERGIAKIFGADAESTIVGWLPMYHDMGLIGTVLHGLYVGASCVLMSPMELLEQPLRWLEAITKYGAHTSGGPNFGYELCVRRITEEQKATLDLSSWRIAFNGAEPVRAATIARFMEAFASCGFDGRAFYPCYGLAEATLAVSGGLKSELPDMRRFGAAALETGRAVAENEGTMLVGCGQSIDDQRIVIVDPESRRERSDGEVGEIWVSGPSIAQGYWEKPEQSEETFRARLQGTEEGPFLRTGDLGFMIGGELFVNGRRKDLIIIRGRNHYPHDLEQTVEQSHPELRTGCGAVFSVDIDGEERIVAVQEVDRRWKGEGSDEVAERIRRRVVEEHEVPLHALVLIKTGHIPKTTSGKIQRSLCRAQYLEGTLPVVGAWTWAEGAEDASGTGETSCAGIAARLLGRSASELDLHAPLFALGLDSLQVFELKNSIERELGVELPLSQFMNDAGLATLAARVAEVQGGARPEPIHRTEGDQPLSHGQRRLWFLDQLAPGHSYNETLVLRLDGSIDADALERAVNTIVARHEVLRTRFVTVDGQPWQHRAASLQIPLKKIVSTNADACIADDAARPFDLAQGPLLRTMLITTASDRHVFAVTVHHIVSDGWSAGIFLRELAAAYVGQPLAPLAVQYADYAAWQHQRLEGESLGEQLAYWREALAGAPTTLSLPLDRPLPPVQTTQGGTVRFLLPADLSERFEQLAREESATIFMALLAAFHVLLHHYTGQNDILIGTPVAGRNRPEAEELIGFFVNTLVLRGDLSGNPTFRELLARVKANATGAYAHQELPFELLVDELKPERTLTQTPLFQVAFALQQPQPAAIRLGAVRGELVADDSITAKFQLALSMQESPSGLGGTLEYNADLFDLSTITQLVRHFEQLLATVAANPSQRVSTLQLLTADERQQMLVDWNATARPQPGSTVTELFREQARLRPEAVALSSATLQVTYGALVQRVDRLAEELRAQGAGPDVLIALQLERGIDAVVALLAVLKSGAAYLPIDPAYPEERIRFMLEDARPLLVIEEGLVLRRCRPTEARSPSAGLSDLAYVIYTSGSTGRPKGVQIEHRGLTNLVRAFAEIMQVTPESRVLQFASLSFDASVEEIFTALTSGACLVLADREELMPVRPLVDTIVRERVTTALLPPSVLALLDPRDTPTLRAIASGGEACSAALAARWNGHVHFVNAYGPTEITVVATADPATDGLSIGRPLANVTAYILDRHDQPSLPGVEGELCIGGAGVARGYLNRPELTAERFIENPFGEGRLYRTGDRARFRADGRIEYMGRGDGQVKLRGFRIELGEIEAALEQHSGVEDALVVVADSVKGGKRLIAYVVPKPGAETAGADLRGLLRERLPEYMVPAAVLTLERFPLTLHGKVDVRALPLPESRRADGGAPRTPVEQKVAELWREVLGVEVVGIDDDFFALGGHSLLATQLLSRVNEAFAVALPLRRLMEAPTVAELAIAVAAHRAGEQEEGELATVLAQLEGLSEFEVSEMLRATAAQF